MHPDVWKVVPKHLKQLQDFVKRINALGQMRNKESNRLEGASKELSMMIKKHIDFIDKQISHIEDLIKDHISSYPDLLKKQKLLSTIPGIGFKTIIHILAFLGNINEFNSAKQLAAFIGLNPRRYQSGSSVNYRTRLSKTGSSVLRKAFFCFGCYKTQLYN